MTCFRFPAAHFTELVLCAPNLVSQSYGFSWSSRGLGRGGRAGLGRKGLAKVIMTIWPCGKNPWPVDQLLVAGPKFPPAVNVREKTHSLRPRLPQAPPPSGPSFLRPCLPQTPPQAPPPPGPYSLRPLLPRLLLPQAPPPSGLSI